MKIVMKFRTVEVTCNGVTNSIRLDTIADTLTFVSVLEKVRVKRDEAKLPKDYLEQLKNHLQCIGLINKDSFDRKKKLSAHIVHSANAVKISAGRAHA